MIHLTKSLRTRIQELTASIQAQKSELGAYEQLLHIENAKESPTHGESARLAAPPAETAHIKFSGNKTTLVTEIVKSLGRAGASPKDVERVFTERKIARSKNLVYNTLSYLVAQKRLQRRDGRYFAVAAEPLPKSGTSVRAKRKISPAGLKRIREGVKKRWAAKRAADRAAAK
jgi:hypothetical protein